jgi:hypothetical protein
MCEWPLNFLSQVLKAFTKKMGLGKGPPSAAGDAREETRKDAFLIIDSLCGVVLLISGACIAAQPPEVSVPLLFKQASAKTIP